MSQLFFTIAFLVWFLAAVSWSFRIYEWKIILRVSIPRWGIVLTATAWISCAMTLVRLFFQYDEISNIIVALLWLTVGLSVLIATWVNKKGDDNGKEN